MAARARLLAGLAVVVAGGLAAGAAYALDQATDDGTPTASASASPSPTATPVETTSESPSPEPSTAPSPTVSATTRPTPSATASPRPSGPVTHYAYPGPTTTYDSLSLSAQVDPQSGAVGQTFSLQGDALDGDGTIFLASINWGDGTTDSGEALPASCPAYPSPTANPGPYQPAPDHRTFTRSHVYQKAGDFTVTVTVNSVNADCRPHGPKRETASVTFDGASRIHVS